MPGVKKDEEKYPHAPIHYATREDMQEIRKLLIDTLATVKAEREVNRRRVKNLEDLISTQTNLIGNWAHISEQLRLKVEEVKTDMQDIMDVWLPTKNAGIATRTLLKGLKWLVGFIVMLSALWAAFRG